MGFEIVPLSELLDSHDEDDVRKLLNGFRCSRDADRETFLWNNSIPMERKAISRTYLAISEDFEVIGYFSVATKCMQISDASCVSKIFLKKLNISKETGVAQAYLIGQLGRSDSSRPGLGAELLEQSFGVISRAYEAVGCRSIRVDCNDELVPYYESHGFTRIMGSDGDNKMVALIS